MIIEFDNVDLLIDGRKILDRISFCIEEGSNTFIMGPSGSGKTTILKIAAGLIFPTSGKIKILNRDISNIQDLYVVRENIGFVFQYSALIDTLTVIDNVLLPIKFRKKREFSKNKKEYIAKAIEILEFLGLKGFENYYPNSLSGGMQKRVAFARAIITLPKIIFYDEPTSGLDPISASQINYMIQEINRKYNITNVVVSHDIISCQQIASFIIFIYQGKIVFKGPPNELINSNNSIIFNFFNLNRI
ncbi:MAG: ATP-binding cassette domain-containing protein [Candidatus Calescibacterium sp.]|nr:ATP-binding cassette domain-containing protein [Candidatus Calescibacterium sp.]MDW8132941.1 ATP-binding cassette domain-containing protein [Candidatus Calescibacterium sp.]